MAERAHYFEYIQTSVEILGRVAASKADLFYFFDIEISIDRIWKMIENDQELMVFYPNFSKSRSPSWDYFWNVSLFCDFCKKHFKKFKDIKHSSS